MIVKRRDTVSLLGRFRNIVITTVMQLQLEPCIIDPILYSDKAYLSDFPSVFVLSSKFVFFFKKFRNWYYYEWAGNVKYIIADRNVRTLTKSLASFTFLRVYLRVGIRMNGPDKNRMKKRSLLFLIRECRWFVLLGMRYKESKALPVGRE